MYRCDMACKLRAMTMREKILRCWQGPQAALARAAQTSSSNLAKITSTRELSKPSYDLFLRIAKALQVPAEWLGDDTADWPPPPSADQQIVDAVRGVMASAGAGGAASDDERRLLQAARSVDAASLRQLVGYAEGLAQALARPPLTDAQKAAEAQELLERGRRLLAEADAAHKARGRERSKAG
jgi:transcriptional regulator with XRE-family HTH domain